MDVDEKVELYQRVNAAWNRGDIDAVLAETTDDWEWDLTDSDIPSESRVHRREEFRGFARRWVEALGPTQVELEGFAELEDGRLFIKILQVGTGAQSGVEVTISYFQIMHFEGSKPRRTQVFTNPDKAHAAAGVVPELRAPERLETL